MHKQDAIYLDQFCPKISNKNWRESLNKITNIPIQPIINAINIFRVIFSFINMPANIDIKIG